MDFASIPLEPFIGIGIFGLLVLLLLAFLRGLDNGRVFGPSNRTYYKRADHMAHKRPCHTKRDYAKLKADIIALREKCRKNSFYYVMIGYSINHVEHRLFMADFHDNLPYATAEEVQAAMAALGLVAGYTPEDLENALTKARHKYDSNRLQQKKAPKEVAKVAQQRLDAAEDAYDLLKNM